MCNFYHAFYNGNFPPFYSTDRKNSLFTAVAKNSNIEQKNDQYIGISTLSFHPDFNDMEKEKLFILSFRKVYIVTFLLVYALLLPAAV